MAVIGDRVKAQLFRGRQPIGEYIEVNGIPFQVVGVFIDEAAEEMETIYLPITTAQRAFNGANRVAMFMLTVGDASVDESKAMADDIRHRIAERHDFDPDDQQAVFISNAVEDFQRFVNLMGGIRMFVWVIGIGTLLAGVVGISNIMMIAVKERTKEIGIRKALGATPWSVMRLVLEEAILVTSVAGYFGLVAGVAVLEIMSRNLKGRISSATRRWISEWRSPPPDILVLSGAIAGFFRRAGRRPSVRSRPCATSSG